MVLPIVVVVGLIVLGTGLNLFGLSKVVWKCSPWLFYYFGGYITDKPTFILDIGNTAINKNSFNIKVYLQRTSSAVGLNWHLADSEILEFY